MGFTKKVYSKTKKVFIYGGGSLTLFFALLISLSYLGIDVQTSGDQVCGDTCISYFNISLKNYSLCFGSTFKGITTDPSVNIEIYKSDSRYRYDNPLRWKQYNLTANKCLDKNKTHEFKIIGYKQPEQTIKWGLSLQGIDKDPWWYGINGTANISTTELLMELGSQVNITANLTGYSGQVCVDIDHPSYGINYTCGTPNANFLFNITYFRNNQFNDSSSIKNLSFGDCYQETANVSSGCGDLNTGTYSFSNNGAVQTFMQTYFNINYSKPDNLNREYSEWIVKHGSLPQYSITIPSSCWSYSSDKLILRIVSENNITAPYSKSYPQCFNGTWNSIGSTSSTGACCFAQSGNEYSSFLYDGNWSSYALGSRYGTWLNSTSSPTMQYVYEEAMNWNIDKVVYIKQHQYDEIINASINLSGYISNGTYPTNVKLYINNTLSNNFDGIYSGNIILSILNDSSISKNLTFTKPSTQIVYLKLLKIANVISAYINLTGIDIGRTYIMNETFISTTEINNWTYTKNVIDSDCANLTSKTGNGSYDLAMVICTHNTCPDIAKNCMMTCGTTCGGSTTATYNKYNQTTLLKIPENANYIVFDVKYSEGSGGGCELNSYSSKEMYLSDSNGKFLSLFTDNTPGDNSIPWTTKKIDITSYRGLYNISFVVYLKRTGAACPQNTLEVDNIHFENLTYGYIPENISSNFPLNPYLESGIIDGTKEWNWSGYFSTTNKTSNFSNSLSDYIDICSADSDGYCNVPLSFISSSAGIIQISDIQVNYTGSRNPIYLDINLIKSFLGNSTNFANIPLKFESSQNGTLQLDDIRLDYAGGNKTIGMSVYIANTIPGLCYQEFSNVSTACGGLATGTYESYGIIINANQTYDGNWSTYGYRGSIGWAQLIINYTRPISNLNGTWQVKFGNVTGNYTLPNSCVNWSATKVRMYIYSWCSDGSCSFKETKVGCYQSANATNPLDYSSNQAYNFENNTNVTEGYRIYEEAMTWNIPGETMNITTWYSKWGFNFPNYVNYLEFIPNSPTAKNVTAYGQTSNTPIFNLTTYNYGGKNMNLSIYLNETFSCVNLTASITSNKPDGFLLNNTWKDFKTNLTYLNNSKLWFWADYSCNYTSWKLWKPNIYMRGCCQDCVCSEDLT